VNHVPGLDGLRAVAVVVVVAFHAGVAGASGGFLGVSLFFTLSGFLITSLLLDEFERTDRLSLRRFYLRRVRRLLPAAYLCLLLVAVWGGWWTAQQQRTLPGDLLASVANVANWRFAFAEASYADLLSGASASPVAHFWSLAIEEQVYLVLPVIMLFALRGGRRRAAAVVGVLLALSVAATLATADRDLVYNGTHTRVAEVLIGAALAIFMAGRRLPAGGWRPVPGVNRATAMVAVTGFLGLVAVASVDQGWIYRGGLALVALLSAMVIAAVVTGKLPVLDARPLVAVGTVSYGIYLFHWPVFLLLDPARTGLDGPTLFALRCAVTAALTIASHRLLEQPIRTGRVVRRNPVMLAATGAGAVAVTLAALIVVPVATPTRTEQILALGVSDVVEFQPTVTASRRSVSAGDEPNAADDSPASSTSPPPPTTQPAPPLRVLVVGSDAAAAAALGQLGGIEVVDAVRPECLLMPVDGDGCRPLPDEVAAQRELHDPDVVVIASGAGESELARSQNAAAVDDASLNELALVHQRAIDALLAVIDDATAAGETVVLSSADGKESPFYARLARVAVARPAVGAVVGGQDALVARVAGLLPTPSVDSAGVEPLRLLVVGDSTSLSIAQALNDGGDGRFRLLWAGANGCPFAPVSAIRSEVDGPWRELECEPYDTKLPPLLDSFEPDALLVMSGPLEQVEQRAPGADAGHVAGEPAFMGARDTTMESLLGMVGPTTPVVVADFPRIEVGVYATEEMLDPRRLDALNAQVSEWDARWEQVERFDYRAPLEAAEAVFGTLRSDGVHPDARQIEDFTRSTLGPQLFDQLTRMRAQLASAASADG
jgi:peptidoglycan/LPS O-acetylase OafA/YrhL